MPVDLNHTIFQWPSRHWLGENPFCSLLGESYMNIYPYNERDNISADTEFRDFESYIIENEYLRAVLCPELGCRLVRLFDKVTGRDVFMLPDAFCPTLIFLRGIFLPVGLELNFPQGHNVHSASYIPMDEIELPDGGRGVQMRVFNAVNRMDHEILFALYPGERLLRQRITFCNTTPVRNGFMYWANAAVPNTSGLEMQVRAPYCHYFTKYEKFPFIDGKDMCKTTNRTMASDLFTIGSDVDWFGFYSPDNTIGALHHATRTAMSGKKMFTWGFDEFARRWGRSCRTPTENGYIEIQAGIEETQFEHTHLEPFNSLTINETWQPIDHISGQVVHANEHIILSSDGASLQVNISRFFPKLRVQIFTPSGVEAVTELFDCVPERGRIVKTPAKFDRSHFTVAVYGQHGNLLMEHTVTPMLPAKTETVKAAQHKLDIKPDDISSTLEVAWRNYKARRFKSALKLLEPLRGKSETADQMLAEIDWWLDHSIHPASPRSLITPDCPNQMNEALVAEADAKWQAGNIAGALAVLPDNDFISQICRIFLSEHKDQIFSAVMRNPFTMLEREALKKYHGASQGMVFCLLGNYYASKQIDVAMNYWKMAVEEDDNCYQAWRNQGYELLRREINVEAARCYRQAVRILPDEPHLLTEYVHCLRIIGASEEALQHLKLLPATVRSDYRIRKLIAEMYYDTGKMEDALKLFYEGELIVWEGEIITHRIYKNSLTGLGEHALKEGDYDSAESYFRRMLDFPEAMNKGRGYYENESAGYYWLGKVAEFKGDFAKARIAWEKAANQPQTEYHNWPNFREEEYFQALAAAKIGDHAKYEITVSRLLEGEAFAKTDDFLHYVNYSGVLSAFRGQLLKGDIKLAQELLEQLLKLIGPGCLYQQEKQRLAYANL